MFCSVFSEQPIGGEVRRDREDSEQATAIVLVRQDGGLDQAATEVVRCMRKTGATKGASGIKVEGHRRKRTVEGTPRSRA